MTRSLPFPHPFFSSRPQWKWFILCTVLVGATMSALDVSIVNVVMPTLTTTFHTSMRVVEWIAMAYMLTLTIFLPLFGRLADMFGRSKLYNLGFVVFTVGSAICGMSGSALFMIVARVVQAVGAGLLQANSVALITQAFPANERGRAIGIQGAVQAVSMAIGPFVGGILISSIGWRAVFYVNIPIGIFGTIAALLILPPNIRPKVREKVDYFGALFLATGLAFLVLAFNDGRELGWTSHVILVYFAHAFVFLGLFVAREFRTPHPLIDLKLFRSYTFAVGNLTGMMSYYVLFAVLFLMPFYFERVLHYGVALTGALLMPIPLAMAVVAPLSGYVSDKLGSRLMTSTGMFLSAGACGALVLLGTKSHLLTLIAELVLLGIGMGLFTPPNNSAIMGAAPKEKLGVAGGLLNMMRSLGLIFGVDISGVVFTSAEHDYLHRKGYWHIHHVFSGNNIQLVTRYKAFMHGFVLVMVVLALMNAAAAGLSAARADVAYDEAAAAAARQLEGG